jgi:hypothetical protein
VTRNATLERRGRGTYPEFYDPEGTRYGLPTYPYQCAPPGLATRRQLRAEGLQPARQPIAAQVLWRRRSGRQAVAYLYRRDLAAPKTPPSPARLAAVQAALLARRICPTCGAEKDYTIPRSLGECADCADEARR